MLLSEYVDFLDGVPKSRYFDKLKVLGLAATDDPYRPYASADFQKAMPCDCGVYTRQELLQWKQLEAYNYFKSVFVRTVKVWDLRNSSQCVILKGLVNPSMRSPDNAHRPCMGSNKERQTAH